MASLYQESLLSVPAAKAWAALRDVANTHELFAGVLTDCHVEGDRRTVTFANGMVVEERIIAIDDERQRIAYTVLGDVFEHHSASMQVVPVGDEQCKFVWFSDFLPDERASVVAPLMRGGCAAVRRSLEG